MTHAFCDISIISKSFEGAESIASCHKCCFFAVSIFNCSNFKSVEMAIIPIISKISKSCERISNLENSIRLEISAVGEIEQPQ